VAASPSRFFSSSPSAPRTVCACRPVASTVPAMVAPLGRLSSACLLSPRI
jgi:hypothetical protein